MNAGERFRRFPHLAAAVFLLCGPLSQFILLESQEITFVITEIAVGRHGTSFRSAVDMLVWLPLVMAFGGLIGDFLAPVATIPFALLFAGTQALFGPSRLLGLFVGGAYGATFSLLGIDPFLQIVEMLPAPPAAMPDPHPGLGALEFACLGAATGFSLPCRLLLPRTRRGLFHRW